MLFLIAMLPQAHADRGWFDRTFGPSDDDDDGIPDRDDNCPTMPERPNGYEDEDGCPDYLSFVTVQATYAGRTLPFAEFWMEHNNRAYVANGPAMSLKRLVPGEAIDVAARFGCLGGEGSVYSGIDPVGIRLALHATRETPVEIQVFDADGAPVEGTLIWTDSFPSPCGPLNDRQELTNGLATTKVGLGTHTYVVRSDRKTYTGSITVTDQRPVSVPVLFNTDHAAGNAPRLPERIYFASGQARLDLQAKSAIDSVAQKLRDQPELSLTVEGHADSRASTRYNLQLALRRSQAVQKALIERGIAATRLSTSTRGESEPADSGYGEAAMALNRRVEFVVR